MPSKEQPPAPQWQVILEDIHSQNRSTIEAVDASRVAFEQRFDRLEEGTRSRFTVVEAALQSTNKGVESLQKAVESTQEALESTQRTVESTQKALESTQRAVESTQKAIDTTRLALEQRIERSDQENRARFAALEAAVQRIDQESRSRDASLEIAVRDLRVSVQENSVDIRDLAGKVAAVARLEERVSALERARD